MGLSWVHLLGFVSCWCSSSDDERDCISSSYFLHRVGRTWSYFFLLLYGKLISAGMHFFFKCIFHLFIYIYIINLCIKDIYTEVWGLLYISYTYTPFQPVGYTLIQALPSGFRERALRPFHILLSSTNFRSPLFKDSSSPSSAILLPAHRILHS